MTNSEIFLDVDWVSLFSLYKDDVETMWNIVKEKVLEGVSKYLPSSLPFSSWKKAMWKRPIIVNTRKIIKQKSKFWKLYIQSRDQKILFSY